MSEQLHKVKKPIGWYFDEVNEICRPLKQLGITGYIFTRNFKDHTFIGLCTHRDWCEFFFEKFYSNAYDAKDMQDQVFINKQINLWIHNPMSQIWQDGARYFSIGNGITFADYNEDYVDRFYLYSDVSNYAINAFYLNNQYLLSQFNKYFLKKAEPLIQSLQKHKLQVPLKYRFDMKPPMESNGTEVLKDFVRNIATDGILLDKKHNNQHLTKREIECLLWLFEGKTALEISMLLDCSKRTVDTHLTNIKNKLGCYKLTSLMLECTKLGIHELFHYYDV
jgi:DNA-binding CsgD family transcriptional regulator